MTKKTEVIMNIMIYNREKSLKSITKEGQRSIRIDRLGNMSVTTALVYEMQLTDGDTVSLANDEDDPKNGICARLLTVSR